MKFRRPARVCLVLLVAASVGCRAPATAPTPVAPALPTSAAVGGANIVAISPPAQQCCPKQTLPQFLGLTGLFHGIGGLLDRLRNRLGGIFPGLEAKPEILALADPANLESANPAVAAAAGVKAEEDAAAQKAKAIAYLASVGCAGCYPGIEEALLAALDDCTELVRFETAKALRSTAAMPCKNCCKSACCGPKIREKLEKLAYDLDDQGCYVESSDRVRRMSRLALANCTCVPLKPGQQPRLPTEGPGAEDVPPAAPPPPAATASIVREPAATAGQAQAGQAFLPAIGNGIVRQTGMPAPQTAEPAPPSQAARPVSYEQALQSYGRPNQAAPPAPTEAAWEVWTARPGDFSSRQEAAHVLTLARTQVMSSQPGQFLPPQLQRFAHDWTDAARIASPAIARAVATTPVGGVSGVIEDTTGWHLVRVIARRPAGVGPAFVLPWKIRLSRQARMAPARALAPPAPVVHVGSMQPSGPGVAHWQLPNCNCK